MVKNKKIYTSEERKRNLAAALKAQKELEKKVYKKEEIKASRDKKRPKLPKGERDYRWCDFPTTPKIEANFVNGKLVSEYSNSKLVR